LLYGLWIFRLLELCKSWKFLNIQMGGFQFLRILRD